MLVMDISIQIDSLRGHGEGCVIIIDVLLY